MSCKEKERGGRGGVRSSAMAMSSAALISISIFIFTSVLGCCCSKQLMSCLGMATGWVGSQETVSLVVRNFLKEISFFLKSEN